MTSLWADCHSHSGERHLSAGGGATPWDLTKWHLHRHTHAHTNQRHTIIHYKAPNWLPWLRVNTNWVWGSSCCYKIVSQRWEGEEERVSLCVCVFGIKNLVACCVVSHVDSQLPVCEAGALPASLSELVSSLSTTGQYRFLSALPRLPGRPWVSCYAIIVATSVDYWFLFRYFCFLCPLVTFDFAPLRESLNSAKSNLYLGKLPRYVHGHSRMLWPDLTETKVTETSFFKGGWYYRRQEVVCASTLNAR